VAVLAAAALPSAAQAGWGRTLRLDGPQPRDILPAQIGFSAAGAAAIAFGVENVDDPVSSTAFAAVRAPSGHVGRARRIPGAREPLAVTYDGSRLALLTGTAPRHSVCCATAQVVVAAGAGHRAQRATLVRGLTGDTEGQLLAIAHGGLMAALSTQRGVWVAQAAAGRLLPSATRLASDGAPQDLVAAPLAAGGAAIAWSTDLGGGEIAPRRIEIALGSPTRPPHDQHVAVVVPAGHSVDELALAAGTPDPTLAWVESWFDPRGDYHSRVEVAPARSGAREHAVSPADELASELSFAAGPSGRQVLAWVGCRSAGKCVARAASRPRAAAPFGRAQRLGAADGAQGTGAAVSDRGQALVGWIDDGNVTVSTRAPTAKPFSRARAISRSGTDADVMIAFGPGRVALAAWTQGTLAASLFARPYFGG
jgi:hypothetical protein